MAQDSALTLLMDCHDQLELAQVCSLLDAHGISYVVQGEHHSQMIMGSVGGGPITPRVLVASHEVERAAQLLAAAPKLDENPGIAIGDGVCPVHEKQAIGNCDRCGTFLCEACGTLGNPPLCEDCVKIESAGLKPMSHRQKVLGSQLALLIPIGVVAVVLVIIALLRGKH